MQRLRWRLHGLCYSADIQHVTRLTLGSQRILEEFEGLNKNIWTKKHGGKPIVDASDVAKLLLALPFVLDGLGQSELDTVDRRMIVELSVQAHNQDAQRVPARVSHVQGRCPVRDRRWTPKAARPWIRCSGCFHILSRWLAAVSAPCGDSEALREQLPHRGQHPDCDDTGDRDTNDVGCQDQGAQDEQPGLVRKEPPREYVGGGRHGAVQAPEQDRYATVCQRFTWFAFTSSLPNV